LFASLRQVLFCVVMLVLVLVLVPVVCTSRTFCGGGFQGVGFLVELCEG